MFPTPIMNHYGNTAVSTPSIKSMNASTGHVYLLYDNGELYTRGNGTQYKLGTGNTAISNEWTLVNTNVKFCALTHGSTTIIKNDNTIWHVGVQAVITGSSVTSSTYTTWTDVTSRFSSVLDISTVVDMQCVTYGVVLLTSSGNTYGVGNGLAIGTYTTVTALETNVQKMYCCGITRGYISTSGTFYRMGTNSAYQLGTGNTSSLSTMTVWAGTGIVQDVLLAINNSYLLVNDAGTIKYYACGQNTNYQLGKGDTTTGNATFITNSLYDNTFKSFKSKGFYTYFRAFALGSSTGLYSAGINDNYQLGASDGTHKTFLNTSTGYTNVSSDSITNIISYGTTLGTFMVILNKYLYFTGNGSDNTNGLFPASTSFTKVLTPYN